SADDVARTCRAAADGVVGGTDKNADTLVAARGGAVGGKTDGVADDEVGVGAGILDDDAVAAVAAEAIGADHITGASDGAAAGVVGADVVPLDDVAGRGIEHADAVVHGGDDVPVGGGESANGVGGRAEVDMHAVAEGIAGSAGAGGVGANPVAGDDVAGCRGS